MTVLSYHNDPAVKAFHVAQAKHHYEADMLLAGTYGNDVEYNGAFRGCSVGCMAHDIDPESHDYHAVVAAHAGWPEWLVHLNDRLFEGLPNGERERFHVDLREAVPVGVDLELVRHHLAIRRMDRLIALQEGNSAKYGDANDEVIDQVLSALIVVRRCHEAKLGGNVCDWSAALSAALSARLSAAESARSESAESAAWSARPEAAEAAAAESARSESAESAAWSVWSARSARSAVWSARSAAWSAAWSADSAARSAAESARPAARSAAYKQEATDLIDILRSLA